MDVVYPRVCGLAKHQYIGTETGNQVDDCTNLSSKNTTMLPEGHQTLLNYVRFYTL
jgi:hypothetical protein